VAAAQKRYREKKRAKMAGAKKRSQATSREEALARRRATKVSYRARHPDKVAAAKKCYREKHRAKLREANKRYYYTHREQRRACDRQRAQTEHRQAWIAQYRAKHREGIVAKQGETENFGKNSKP